VTHKKCYISLSIVTLRTVINTNNTNNKQFAPFCSTSRNSCGMLSVVSADKMFCTLDAIESDILTASSITVDEH
jgi:hypothetical protein